MKPRGFASVIAVLAAFAAAIILLNTGYQENETISFKNNFPETKLFLTAHALALERGLMQCDPSYSTEKCVADYNQQIIVSSAPQNTSCKTFVESEADGRSKITLDCITLVEDSKAMLFWNHFRKIFFVRR
ncbi:MAG: hypothetical protein NTZ73_04275 [Candidatus Diapherotrites archaeon]|nr:hypothetical protein [Candidatus Diapherotrites archaeon]